MSHTTLISPQALQDLMQQDPAAVLVLDCSFDLADPDAGRRVYESEHVPGASYIHLDRDLSGPKTGSSGRHPLPARETFAARMAALGANPGTQIVAYDNAGGMVAARVWWMLRWIGHEAAAVLDGGLAAWRAAGYPASDRPGMPHPAGTLVARDPLVASMDYEALRAHVQDGSRLVVDARAADRFRGENETIDPVGGHIPGARNRFFRQNLDDQGRFKAAAALRAEYEALMAGRPATEVVAQCGSGVTACHNLLAMEVAGLPGASLYPGSWSEWSSRPDAPMATGTA